VGSTLFCTFSLIVPDADIIDLEKQQTSSFDVRNVQFYGQNEKELLENQKSTNHKIFMKMNDTVTDALSFYRSNDKYSGYLLQCALVCADWLFLTFSFKLSALKSSLLIDVVDAISF
jgi:hypothetical protein